MAAELLPLVAQQGGNFLSSTATAGLQILGNTLNNQQQQDYNDTVINRAETAFTQAGLPRYMAYTNGNSGMPVNKFQVAGGNFYSAGPVNSNLPTFTSQTQLNTHSAKPRTANEIPPPEANIPTFGELGHENIQMRNIPIGQTNRQGLGAGRYANNFVSGGIMQSALNRNSAVHQAFAGALQ